MNFTSLMSITTHSEVENCWRSYQIKMFIFDSVINSAKTASVKRSHPHHIEINEDLY